MERLLEELSFDATDIASRNAEVLIDLDYVNQHLENLAGNSDLSRYIL
jgi:ATP-dependent HslUV protease ATP-binding subunit HslU